MRYFYSKFRFWNNKRFLRKYRKNSRESLNSKGTKILVIATCIVAISSMATVWITWDKSSDQIEIMQDQVNKMKSANKITRNVANKQIEEMQKATELSYRPYLSIEMFEPSINFQYFRDDSSFVSENQVTLLDTIGFDNFGSGYFQLSFSRDYNNKNIGKSPLWFCRTQSGVVNAEFWNSMHDKPLAVCRDTYIDSVFFSAAV